MMKGIIRDGVQSIRRVIFGNGTDYSEFEADGTLEFNGAATVFRDELQSLVIQLKNNPSDKLIIDNEEGAVGFKPTASLTDYATMNVQLNHDRKIDSVVYPHLHWWQTEDAVPNWLIQYRWQDNGSAKATAWTNMTMISSAFTYVSGTLNQISSTASGITPPAGAGLSDILQLRLIRDTANTSTLFAGADTYTTDAYAVNFDVHIEVNTVGSRQQFVK